MLKTLNHCFLLLLLALQACNSGTGNQQDFSQLGNDKEFKEAHEVPKEANGKALRGEMIDFPTTDELAKGKAYFAKATESTDSYLLMIHEWWGLNDHIKQEADRYQEELGVNVLALDLYDGNIATTREDASAFMKKAKPERCKAIINGALAYAGDEAKVGTVGWCFGGGWSLNSSILAGTKSVACVIYYGMPEMDAKKLAPLQAEVLGLFAEKDKWITPKVANDFEAVMKALGKEVSIHQFDADHAFANPSSERYDNPAALAADKLAFDFLSAKLK